MTEINLSLQYFDYHFCLVFLFCFLIRCIIFDVLVLTIKTLAGLFILYDVNVVHYSSWLWFTRCCCCILDLFFSFLIFLYYIMYLDYYLHIYRVSCFPPDPSDMTDPPYFLSQHIDLMSRAGQPRPIRARTGELATNGRRAGDMWWGSRGHDTSHFLSQCPVSGACGEWQGRRDTLSTSDNERRYWSGNKTPQILILHLNYSLLILALFCFRKGREDGVEFQYFVVAHKTFNCCVWPGSGYDSIVSGSKC